MSRVILMTFERRPGGTRDIIHVRINEYYAIIVYDKKNNMGFFY